MNYEAVFVDWHGTLSNSLYWKRWKTDPNKSEQYKNIQGILFEPLKPTVDNARLWMADDLGRQAAIDLLISWGRYTDEMVMEKICTQPESAELLGNGLMHNWMLGNISHEGVVDFVSAHTNIPSRLLSDELHYSAENMQFNDETALTRIEKLRAMGTLVILATDNTDLFEERTIPALQLNNHFDDILCSSSVHHLKSETGSKGNSRFFGPYMQKMGILPEYSVLIDDSTDLAAIEKTGMKLCQVTTQETLISHLDQIITHS